MSQLKAHWQLQYQVLSLHLCPSGVVLSQRVELAKKSLQTLQNNGFGTWFSDLCTPPVSKAKHIHITTKCTGRSYLRATRKNGLVFGFAEGKRTDKTLVFAVYAIICLLSGFHVLMVAPTDSAADIMAESLMKLLKEAKSSHLNRSTYIAACSESAQLGWNIENESIVS